MNLVRKKNGLGLVLVAFLAWTFLVQAGCDESSSGEPVDEDAGVQRPEGWQEESHGFDAEARYDLVFPQKEVGRLDLVFSQADWNDMLDDLEFMLGPFGAMAGEGGIDQVNVDACDGLEEGVECTAVYGAVEYPGVCAQVPYEDFLVCTVTESGGPPEDGIAPILVPWDPVWKPCTVEFNGDSWKKVGMRFKGNSTLVFPWLYGQMKLPFKLDFDQFEFEDPAVENQRFWGFKKISFANNARDSSYLREKVAGDLFRRFEVPSPARAFYRVFVDHGEGPEYMGLYTAVEVPGKTFVKDRIGTWGGTLYKPEGLAANWTWFEKASFPLKSDPGPNDFEDVRRAVEALNGDRSDPAVWRQELEELFYVDGFLRWLCVNTVIQDWDTYGFFGHNYYLYGDPGMGGILRWVPWDHNESFRTAFVELGFDGVGDDWPLIRFLMDDPVYTQRMVQLVNEFAQGPFSSEEFLPLLQSEHELIEPYVTGEEGESLENTLLEAAEHFDMSYQGIIDHYQDRLLEVDSYTADAGM